MTIPGTKYGRDQGSAPLGTASPSRTVLGRKSKGTRTSIEALDEEAKYSWIKSPRWKGNAVEVGPLAHYIIGYAAEQGRGQDPTEKFLRISACR